MPLVLGAIIGGSVLGGAVLGSAANNAANYNAYVANGRTVVATNAPGVTVGSTTCYFTRAWDGYAWRRVQVCNNSDARKTKGAAFAAAPCRSPKRGARLFTRFIRSNRNGL